MNKKYCIESISGNSYQIVDIPEYFNSVLAAGIDFSNFDPQPSDTIPEGSIVLRNNRKVLRQNPKIWTPPPGLKIICCGPVAPPVYIDFVDRAWILIENSPIVPPDLSIPPGFGLDPTVYLPEKYYSVREELEGDLFCLGFSRIPEIIHVDWTG